MRPTTAWRRAAFREKSWRFLTGITVADTGTIRCPAFTDDTIADFKRASRGLTPGERPMPPYPYVRPEMPVSYRLWRRQVLRKMKQDMAEIKRLAADRLRELGFAA